MRSLRIIQISKYKIEVLGQMFSNLFVHDHQYLIWKVFSIGNWIWQLFHSILMLKCKEFKSKFKEIEVRKKIRVIDMAFFTSKEFYGLQEFGNFRKFLYMIKLSFLNLCVTEFRLPALHLIGQTASDLLRATKMFDENWKV